MSFKALLKEIVSKVEGAEGAIFLDSQGEAVEWYSLADGEQLRLRAAYLAVVFQACKGLHSRLELKAIRYLSLEYEGAVFIIQDIEDDYFFMIELNYSANFAQALFKIQSAVAALRRELAA